MTRSTKPEQHQWARFVSTHQTWSPLVCVTSTGVLSIRVGVLGWVSVFISSTRGRGGVAMKTGVTGISGWSARVGVAHGEP